MAMICIAMTIFVSCKKNNVEPSGYGTHEYVELGLPSGTLWATCNIGAESPEDYGDYFAWGETTPKDNYDWSTYKWCNGSYNTITKYNINPTFGAVDNKTILELSDDAAHVNWGGNWRIPTKDEMYELIKNCTWECAIKKGVNGRNVIGPNGNSIFLPAGGYCTLGCSVGLDGYYWTSSLYAEDSSGASNLLFYSDGVFLNSMSFTRTLGQFVRPVSAPQNLYVSIQ